jgi:hypothetical protein
VPLKTRYIASHRINLKRVVSKPLGPWILKFIDIKCCKKTTTLKTDQKHGIKFETAPVAKTTQQLLFM